MARLSARFTPQFKRDFKQLQKKHVDTAPLESVFALVLENSERSHNELVRRHNMHVLTGVWKGSYECHVANAGDWLLIWKTGEGLAVFQRTGSHDELFR
ncbi:MULTISPECIES: type II toxin-antitoxin system RelE/ParE family toxin [Gordonibacter]|uniref:Type II toxin-antitoxin system YafQ family toxin n=1 Tax=Gordonibacter faecis TaxID=3047475 RepID=A0ABT7DQ71_9ACTN|nr:MULTISPECIES: type II toxin-antitoxin system YafQ family toxin [unclassified Gordonibacter]MDJ1650641.1 type II toxin-antitoxin system YafQ family toxin [Gordonibacter sp. KGMB12511]HIW75809.1 type II toxin-antitoxin system YafQ family toxin [Candidatus Gordonibacter avicola]